ncbi:MAG: hypothetical protein FWG70_09070 [Oscillospiraceae bacterium]|nr:hypothetical protein [Oscillospiraceae bacterium]
MQNIERIEKSIARNEYETVIVFDTNGKELFRASQGREDEVSLTSDENVSVPFGGTPFKHANANDLVKKFEEIAEQMGMPVEWRLIRG